MITITQTPTNLSSSFLPVSYSITNSDSTSDFEVKIYDSTLSELLGIKRFSSQQDYCVSLGDYLQYRFDINPISCTPCTLVKDEQKLQGIAIKVDSLDMSDVSWHTFGAIDASVNKVMSSAPLNRKIAWDGYDELSVLLESGTLGASYSFNGNSQQYIIELDDLQGDDCIVTLVTNMAQLAQMLNESNQDILDFDSFSVNLSLDNAELCTINYQITSFESQAIKLCWLNKYGALDYYVFTGDTTASSTISKQRIYSSSGYKVTGSELSRTTEVYSDFLTQSDMLWLSELLASPMVWKEVEGSFEMVDITSSSCTHLSKDLMRLSFSLREGLNHVYQHI